MGKVALVLTNAGVRGRAKAWIDKAPSGAVFTLADAKRSIPQNSRLWAMLTDVALQCDWPTGSGTKRSTEQWKDIFTAALLSAQNDLEVVPGINGGFVLLGMHTSSMDKAEFGDLMTLIEAFGAEHGVQFHDGQERGGSNAAPVAA